MTCGIIIISALIFCAECVRHATDYSAKGVPIQLSRWAVRGRTHVVCEPLRSVRGLLAPEVMYIFACDV